METLLSSSPLFGRMADMLHPLPTTPPGTGDQSLDRFVSHFVDALHFFETVDPYAASSDPRKPYLERADRFLQKYAGMSYQQVQTDAPIRDLNEEDYGLVTPPIKKRLFDFRARLYLAALDACDQEGMPISELLPKIRDAVIPPIKKEACEPTFEILLTYLKV